MKLYIYLPLLVIALHSSATLVAGGILGAASDMVHGATNIATGTADAALNTAGNVVSPRPYYDSSID